MSRKGRAYVLPYRARQCHCLRRYVYLPIKDVAEWIGVHKTTVWKWETGRRPMPVGRFIQYRNILKRYYDRDPFKYPPELSPEESVQWLGWLYGVSVSELARCLGVAASTLWRKFSCNPICRKLDAKGVSAELRKIASERGVKL